MKTSPSQLVNFLACHRKWWFKSIHKLRDNKDPAARDIGTVLHEVCGRWLLADDQGRDRAGLPVELYPEGWEKVREFHRDTGRAIDIRAQAFVRVMVQQAIDNGTLRRLPGRQVERRMEIPIIDGVTMEGYLDQDGASIVEDHKTTKTRKYALGKQKLAADEKMLCYAVMKLDEKPDAPVTLRLNYFDKSGSEVPWAVEACIKPERVINFLEETIRPAVAEMRKLRESNLPIDSWRDVPGPNRKGACEEYGGCPYAEVCSNVTTIERFQKILPKTKTTEKKTRTTMSFFKKRPKFAEAPTTTPTTAEPTEPAAEPETVSPPKPGKPVVTAQLTAAHEQPRDDSIPPWAVSSCRPCSGRGLIKGRPCRACDLVQSRSNGPVSSQYENWLDEKGVLRWKPAGGAKVIQAKTEDTVAPPQPVTVKITAAEPKEVGAVLNSQTVKIETAAVGDVSHTTVEIPMETEQKTEGFRLYIGCMPLGVRSVMTINDVLSEEGIELAAAMGKPSYYSIDAFQRRDAIASRAEAIADALAGMSLVAPAELTPDERSLLAALQPLAMRPVVIRI